jgi:Gram-negative bacterial TonB protein C-terminal
MKSGVQRYPRTRMVLPLRVWVGEQADETSGLQLAHTIDISPIGGRLGGLRTELLPGQTITLQRGQLRAPFRVIWNTCLAPGENQAGVEAVGLSKNIWGVELPKSPIRRSPAEHVFAAANSADEAVETPAPRSRPAYRLPAIFRSKRNQWAFGLGFLILVGLLCLAPYRNGFSSAHLAIHWASPVPPTAAELAQWDLKPRRAPLADEVTTWHSSPVPRIAVVEAPNRHMVYPVSPNVKLSGKVNLNVLIATDGHVKVIKVVSGKQPFVHAAEQAARQWRYSPYAVKGEPAEGEANVVVAFRGADAVSLEFPSASGSQGSKN